MKLRLSSTVIGQAASAGLLAGALIGIGEVILLATVGGNTDALQALMWAVLGYGLLGLLLGLALGVILAILRPSVGRLSTYALVWPVVFSALGLFITR